MANEFLGAGWKFPVTVDSNTGKVAMSQHEEDIQEAIRIILFTAKGERLMRPEFGCGIHDYLFETINMTTLSLIESSVWDALNRFEPRIETMSVTAKPDLGANGKLMIDVRYRVRTTNNEDNVVFPFYLREG